MSPPPKAADAAIDALVEDLAVPVRLVAEALERPEADRRGLAVTALDLVFASLAARLSALAEAPGVEPARRERCAALAREIRRIEARSIRVEHHLADLSSDWRCPACGSRVAGGAVWSAGPRLVCRRCNKSSDLTESGRRMFEKIFAVALASDFDPARHGFGGSG